MIGYIIAGIIIILLVVLIISKYNKLVRLKNKVQNAFAQIEAHLQRRFDLIPNLVEVVKGYTKHEKETLESVIEARNSFQKASTPEDHPWQRE